MDRAGLIYLPEKIPIKEWLNNIKLAEKIGYESVWIAEHYYFRDAFSSMAAFAMHTKKIRIGTSIINPYTRNPVITAMNIATIDELSNGRTILGLGAGIYNQIEREMGIKMDKPLKTMKEYIEVFRKIISYKNVNYAGDIFNINNVKLGFEPIRKYIPIYLGALGPKMLRLSGKIADGTILIAGSSIDYTKSAIEQIKKGASEIDRDPSSIDIASIILVSISENSDEAKNKIRKLVAYFISIPNRGELMLKNINNKNNIKQIRKYWLKGDRKNSIKYVTDEMIDTMTVSGTPSECKDKINKYKTVGVKLPIYYIISKNIKIELNLLKNI